MAKYLSAHSLDVGRLERDAMIKVVDLLAGVPNAGRDFDVCHYLTTGEVDWVRAVREAPPRPARPTATPTTRTIQSRPASSAQPRCAQGPDRPARQGTGQLPMVDYLSAEQLQISHEERDALIAVAEAVEGFPFRDEVLVGDRIEDDDSPAGVLFNMGFTGIAVKHCGTVACLGGHVSLLMQGYSLGDLSSVATTPDERYVIRSYVEAFEPTKSRSTEPLARLYYPDVSRGFRADPEQAARATLNFLTTGYPKWDEVMGPDPDDSLEETDEQP